MIIYTTFWETLKKKNISTYELIEKHNINANTLTRIRNNKYLSLRTIDDLCRILDCKIQDIVVYVKD